MENSGTLFGIPENDHVGRYYLMIVVSDGRGGSDEVNLTLDVIDVNDPPIVTSDLEYQILEDEELTIELSVEDMDDPLDTMVWKSWDTLQFMDLFPDTGKLIGTPSNEDVGSYALNLSVTDERGGTTFFVITISVGNANDPPALVPVGDMVIMEDSDIILWLEAIDIDPTNDILLWKYEFGPDFLSLDEDTGLLTGRPENDDVGVHMVNISVKDQKGGIDHENFMIEVVNVNDPPIKIQDTYSLSIEEDQIGVILNVMDLFTDPDNDPLTIYVENVLNIRVKKIDSNNISLIPLEDWFGEASFEILAKDAGSGSRINVTITINEVNDAPRDVTITPMNDCYQDVNTFKLRGSAFDPDIEMGDSMEFIWTSNISGEIGRGEEVDVSIPAGLHNITLTVKDSSGEMMEASIEIHVLPIEEDTVIQEGRSIILMVLVILIILVIIGVLLLLLLRKKGRGKDDIRKE
jgi:hypothetical protein